jgi:stage II sporulation protein AB (anti-sigma F factor)
MDAKSENESFARVAVAGFIAGLDPTLEELNEVKTAVSEAVTNAVIHGYESEGSGKIHLKFISDENNVVTITISDYGKGIDDIEKAMQPLYTSKPDMERSGMGFTVMDTFMDSTSVSSVKGEGTVITMTKKIKTLEQRLGDE